MALDVRFHFLLALECLIANGAFVAFRAVVLDAMQFKNMIVAKIAETNVAMVWLFAGVRTRMDLQLFGTGKALAATLYWTFVWFLACTITKESKRKK